MEKGYYEQAGLNEDGSMSLSQSTIKMEKGYYLCYNILPKCRPFMSQSTIKMEKGYYKMSGQIVANLTDVAIHNKNGKGLLRTARVKLTKTLLCRNPQ